MGVEAGRTAPIGFLIHRFKLDYAGLFNVDSEPALERF